MRSIFIFVLFTFSSPSWADDVGSFLNSYVNSYTDYLNSGNKNDVTKVTDHFHTPLLQVPPTSAPFIAKDEEAVVRNFGAFMSRIHKAGVRKIEWEKRNFVLLDESRALASNLARMLDENGKVVRRSAGIYSLYRFEDGWKIIMIQSVSENNVLSLKRVVE